MKAYDVYFSLEKEFAKRGFSLYIVGGTSRDIILGRQVEDFDFVTDATVDEMKEFLDVTNCFSEVGSLTCLYMNHKIDLTTLREEDEYLDYRHPNKVRFVKDVRLDAKRRDFTINALYIDKNNKIIDFYEGQEDLHSRLIRMIGEPDKRIKEDPLRILRALRFSLILDFDLDSNLKSAIYNNLFLLRELNYSKCLVEINKMYEFNKNKARKLLSSVGVDKVIPVDLNAKSTPVIDMHCDTITRDSIIEDGLFNNEDLHIDINKMKKGNYMLQCFAVFVNLGKQLPFISASRYIDRFYKVMEDNKSFITPVTHYYQVSDNFSKNKISALLTIEEGGVLEGNIKNLEYFYSKGVRMMSLTWNYPNELGYPNINCSINSKVDIKAVDDEHGLTSFGKEVVKKMNELGMIIDVSHLNDAGTRDVLNLSSSPIVASHSNSRTICGVGRNLPDDLIKEIASKNGLIGMNYCPSFLSEEEFDDATDEIVKHILYIKSIAGIDCIGLGSDFDGIPTPKGLEEASKIGLLDKKLKDAGLTELEREKIFYKNFLRVLKRVCK